jgi:hypothetical protein
MFGRNSVTGMISSFDLAGLCLPVRRIANEKIGPLPLERLMAG